MPEILSPAELASFERDGYVLKVPPLSPQELDVAEATFDRLVSGAGPPKEEDEGFIKLISHPWLEAVAQQVLRTERVRYIELGPHHRPAASEGSDTRGEAGWQQAWQNGAHIDLQVTTSDFDATPRRDMLALWLWVSDVPPERAAMRILPGSHRAIQRHWEETLKPEHRSLLPRVHGLFPSPSPSYPSYPEFVPEPEDFKYTTCEPTPVAVPRGTAQIFTQSMLHSSWHNSDTQARKGFILSWMAAEVPCGFVEGRCEGLRSLFPKLRASVAKWQPGREHVVYSAEEFNHFVTEYDPAWEETFIEGKTMADCATEQTAAAARL